MIKPRNKCLVVMLLLASLLRLPAQTNVIDLNFLPRAGTITIQGGSVIRFRTNQQPNDPLVNLMMSQPQIDTDGPVSVLAEFDPPSVEAGQRATLRLVLTTLSETVDMPEKLPSPAGLDLQAGGRGQSFQNIGMKIQARTTFNFRARAKAPGTYTVPAFAVTVSGRKVIVPATQLIVVAAGGDAPSSAAPQLMLEVPETEIYVGQSVPAKVILTDPGDNSAQAMMHAQVIGEAFLTDTSYARLRREAALINGQPRMSLVSEVLITPIREGTHQVLGQAFVIINRPLTTLLSQLPGYFPLYDTDPVKLNVKHVPTEGELPGYTGAIGTFEVEPPQLSASGAKAGEPVTLRIGIRGDGNFSRFTPPKLSSSRDWQAFPPERDSSAGSQMQRQGFAQFAYTLIPQSDRVSATPPIPFSYYDPAKKRYVDLTIPSVPLKVTPAAGTVAGQTAAASSDPDDPLNNNQQLVMAGLVTTPGSTVATLTPLQTQTSFLALQLVPAGALLGLWWWDRRRRFHERHPEVMRKRRARRALASQLRLARRAAAAQDSPGFVTAAVGALRHAAAPHSAANPDALVCRDVLRELPTSGAKSDEECVRKLFHDADALRFIQRVDHGAILPSLVTDFERVAGKLKERL